MKRIAAIILVTLLVAPLATAGQRLGTSMNWEKVKSLKAGTEIIVLAGAEGSPTKVKLLFADDSILVTLTLDAPKPPGKVQRALLQVGNRWPGIFNGTDSITSDEVRVSADGVFDRDRKVAELSALVQQMPRGDIRGITDVPHSHWVRNVVIVAAVGMGAFLAVRAYVNSLID